MSKFEELKATLLEICEKERGIPSQVTINNSDKLPSAEKLRKIFRENGYDGYRQFCESNGYRVKGGSPREIKYISYEELCDIWDQYYKVHNKYPATRDCANDKSLPTWSTVVEICGDRYNEFYEKYGSNHRKNKEDYDMYCDLFKQICEQEDRILKWRDLNNNTYGLPEGRWFIRYCPDENVKDYNQFLSYLGYKPRYNITKEYAIEAIHRKAKEVGRNLKKDDFDNPNGIDEISISIIDKHWGSFNNMLQDLGFPINQESMLHRQRPLARLVYDIFKLCSHIKETDNRLNIARSDVEENEWCLNPQAYDRWFKRELNMNLSQFIEHIGFIPNKSGMGMVYKFDDGEITTSKFEYEISKYLKSNNIKYTRNIRYNEFTKGYRGNKDCDYVIHINDKVWYIEVAGMLDYRKVSRKKDDSIREKYKKDLQFKEKLLIKNKLNYKIIYPDELHVKPLNEVFSFLWEETENINEVNRKIG